MIKTFKERFKVFKLTLGNPLFLAIFGLLQAARLFLGQVPSFKINPQLLTIALWMPWYGWVIGWLVLFWFSSIEYAVKRKEVFDQTSMAFFKAYLDSLIKQGNNLFNYSEEKDFFSKINDWQHQVIQGLAIGLGPEASQKYFHEMDKKTAVKEGGSGSSLALKTSDSLCRILQENLEELNRIRTSLAETLGTDREGLEADKNINLIGGSKG